MAAFVAIAMVLGLCIFAWVLRPLWRPQPIATAVAVVALLATTAVLYSIVGTPDALDPRQRDEPASLQDAIARLEGELRRDPNQVDGLRLLARAYAQQSRNADARDAYARALRLAPDDADLLAEAAEARALADPDRRFDDQALAYLQHALQVQPMHQRARWFLGVAQRQRGENAAAAGTWEPLLAQIDASTAAALRPQIDAARRDAGLPPLPQPATARTPASTAGANAIDVSIQVDPALAARMPDATVFVLARIPGGPPMPVAVERHPLRALPGTVTLDDGDSPMPTQTLSSLKEVDVIARVSASGDAMRKPGDIESQPVRVALPSRRPITIVLGNR